MTYKYRVYLVTGQFIDVTSSVTIGRLNLSLMQDRNLEFNEGIVVHDKVAAVLTYEEGTDHSPRR